MAGGGRNIGSYSPVTGFIFIFNLIVGAGALTIPHAFIQVGLVYGIIALAILATTSYVTSTFMVETIAGVNALKKRMKEMEDVVGEESPQENDVEDFSTKVDDDQEDLPLMVTKQTSDRLQQKLEPIQPDLVFDFDLSSKMELAQMATLLYGRKELVAFYLCVIVYLYGDLAIYAVAVPKSLREIICPRPGPATEVWECSGGLNSSELYKVFVIFFSLVLGPFAFGHVQKTRTLQLITTIVRHVSFALMIVLALIGIAQGEGRSFDDVIAYQKPGRISTFFGVCIYSFMCHHSIPGLVAPITDKKKVGLVLACSFTAVFLVYVVLCISATFRFTPEEIDDVYTLNFKKYSVRAIAYFLSLFPVCTLSANFPVICITLRENLRTLFHKQQQENQPQRSTDSPHATIIEKYSYGLLAIVPPLIVAFFTEDVSMLVGITGAYAGLGIQWIVPTSLVYYLRQRLADESTRSPSLTRESHRYTSPYKTNTIQNPYASQFSSPFWIYATILLSFISLVFITMKHAE